MMKHINPTFYMDMEKVFQTERTPMESKRYVNKILNCEDILIKSPSTSNTVFKEMNYELSKMKSFRRYLEVQSRMNKIKSFNTKSFQEFKKSFLQKSKTNSKNNKKKQ